MSEDKKTYNSSKSKIKINYDGNSQALLEQSTSLEDALRQLPKRHPEPVAAIVNGELHELDYRLYTDSQIIWLDYQSADGNRIYKRSLVFVLLIACTHLYPEYKLKINHSLHNSIYCTLTGQDPVSADMVAAIEKEMQRLVEADEPILRNLVSLEDAISFFLSEGKLEKALLLQRRVKNEINLYTCFGITEYFFGDMASRTGLLKDFQLMPFDEGFVMQLPAQEDGTFSEGPFSQPRQLQATLKEAAAWDRLMKLETVSDLNNLIEDGKMTELTLIAETMHERKLHKISDEIFADFPKVRVILIAGPSSSGKTTFTRRLSIQFRTLGIRPIAISMDDYFLDRDHSPVDNKGQKDYESIRALDLDLFNEHLDLLISGQEACIPRYDFITGTRTQKCVSHRLQEDQIIIIEGIHALNEQMSFSVPKKNKRKIYVSALTQLNMDDYTPIPTSDNRLYRRIIRDMHCRNISPEETIMRWPSVREGEAKNIFPYQEEADYFFNSALIYELPTLRTLLEDELSKIKPPSPAYIEAKRLLRFIQYFTPAQTDQIPKNSILQEFVGESCFID